VAELIRTCSTHKGNKDRFHLEQQRNRKVILKQILGEEDVSLTGCKRLGVESDIGILL
jgi:hypothetical protein